MSSKRILVLFSALLLGFAFSFASFADDAAPSTGTPQEQPKAEAPQQQPQAQPQQAQASTCEKFDSTADGFWCEHCNAEVPADHVDKDKDGKEIAKAVPAKFGVRQVKNGDTTTTERIRLEEKDGALLVAGTDKKVCPIEAAKPEENKVEEKNGDEEKANGKEDENKGSEEAPAPKSDDSGSDNSGD